MPVQAQAASNDNETGAPAVMPASLTGLDEAEAQRRLARHGPNAVRRSAPAA